MSERQHVSRRRESLHRHQFRLFVGQLRLVGFGRFQSIKETNLQTILQSCIDWKGIKKSYQPTYSWRCLYRYIIALILCIYVQGHQESPILFKQGRNGRKTTSQMNIKNNNWLMLGWSEIKTFDSFVCPPWQNGP